MADHLSDFIETVYGKNLRGEAIDPKQFSTGDLQCIAAYRFLDPESPMYGHIICFLSYQDHLYKGLFHIHTPKQKFPHLSNRMMTLDEVTADPIWGLNEVLTCLPAGRPDKAHRFWDQAFWTDARFKDLETEGDRLLRTVMNNFKSYSRENNLCAVLRRTDKYVKR